VIIKDEKRSRISAYRWHIEDAIPFTKSIRFTIEHGTGNGISADYSSVAYYYLAGPSPQPPALPADLLPSDLQPLADFSIPGAIEAEGLVPGASATGGGVWSQDMGNWEYGAGFSGRAALFWSPGKGVGDELTVQLPSAVAGDFSITARVVCGPNFGTAQFLSGGEPLGVPVDLFSLRVTPKEVSLGKLALRPGANPISVRISGRNPLSKGYGLGIDAFIVTPSG
jgi:hypothetical protein